MTSLTFDYYYGVQAEQFAFYRIPRLLIKDEHFKGLSSDAKLLYGLMLDRMTLSMKNHWLDDENRAYIIYSISNVMEDINCSKPTCVKIMKELAYFGLIERKRKGLGKPDIIYVKNFAVLEDEQENGEECEEQESHETVWEEFDADEEENVNTGSKESELSEVKNFEFRTGDDSIKNDETDKNSRENEENSSKKGDFTSIREESELLEVKDFNFMSENVLTSSSKEPLPLEVKNLTPNYNNNNYTDNSQNNSIIYQSNLSYQSDRINDICRNEKDETDRMDEMDQNTVCIRQIKKNLDYDRCMSSDRYSDKNLLKELFDIICDVVCAERKEIKISGVSYPYEYVRSRFLELTCDHVSYVMDCMKDTTTNIVNIKAYLLAVLFNAPSTIDHYYQQKVQHDLHSDAIGGF